MYEVAKLRSTHVIRHDNMVKHIFWLCLAVYKINICKASSQRKNHFCALTAWQISKRLLLAVYFLLHISLVKPQTTLGECALVYERESSVRGMSPSQTKCIQPASFTISVCHASMYCTHAVYIFITYTEHCLKSNSYRYNLNPNFHMCVLHKMN